MYQAPLFLKPVFKEKIWGGQNLKQQFGYPIPSNKTGEAWIISAHDHGANIIENGQFKGLSLQNLWQDHKDLFNKTQNHEGAYPLLVKLLDANDNLSVQVHPNDAYANQVENVPYGKTECWYVVAAENDAELIIGHNAQSKEEFDALIAEGKWDKLLHYQKVQPGDFFYVPSGTIHAIGKGIVILETQQSSDTTYRVYDYDRKDKQGHTRELHLQKAKDVTTIPHDFASNQANEEAAQSLDDLTSKKLIDTTYFAVYHWQLEGEVVYETTENFLQISVLDGLAELVINHDHYTVKKGQNFILPHGVKTFALKGQAEFIMSHE